jgi:hypothetical protein
LVHERDFDGESGVRVLWGIGAVLAVVTVGLLALRLTGPRPSERGETPRVLLVGDSLLNEAGPAVRTGLEGMQVVDATVPGSGLLTSPVDWITRIRHLLSRVHPSLVVASFIGNEDRSASHLIPNSRAYYVAWNEAATRLTGVIRRSGARVYWVAQPPIARVNFYGLASAQPRDLSRLYRRLGQRSGTRFVDGSASIASHDGTFAITKVVCGRPRTLRLADGVHFTAAGAAWWGIHIAAKIAHFEGQHIDTPCRLFDRAAHERITVTSADQPSRLRLPRNLFNPVTDDSQELRSRL